MNRRGFSKAFLLAAGALLRRQSAAAGEATAADKPDQTAELMRNPNAVAGTLGGKQFWADERFFHQWHIQRNSFTGHYRLLDGTNRRHAWGTFDECLAVLDEIKHKEKLPPMKGRAVVVLHGLFRTPSAMSKMCGYLRDEGNLSVFNVTYPTTRAAVAQHAAQLAGIIEHLDGIEEIHFVAHSLGNLVIRHYLGDTDSEGGKSPDPRIKRIVMLGPPNGGARLAEILNRTRVFGLVAGQSALQIAKDWSSLSEHLATPKCEFGIIAGAKGNTRGYNPILREDNDLVVSVESTRLPGAADFAVVPVVHTFLMDDPLVQQYTLRFLKHGYFISPEKRNPIPTVG